MKKNKIKYGRIAHPVIEIEISVGTKVKEVIKNDLIPGRPPPSIGINGKIESLEAILKNGDLLVMIYPIHGEATVKRNGNSWIIHPFDKDNQFPSDFHAHNLETKEKLDLYTGLLYQRRSKSPSYGLDKKDWIAILIKLQNGKDENLATKAANVLKKLGVTPSNKKKTN